MPSDVAGISNVLLPVLLTPDGRSYVYSYGRFLNDLYLVDGLK